MNDDIFNSLAITFLQLKGWGNQNVKIVLDANKKFFTNSKLTLNDIKSLTTNIDNKKTNNLIEKITPEDWDLANKKATVILEQSKKNNIKILNFLSLKYPQNLKVVQDHPAVLYIKGNLEILNNYPSLATIGSRNPLDFVKKLTDRLIGILVENEFITVSGLALGIDRICHASTLRYGGKTIAILPGGLDTIYPKKNQKLADDILENDGTLISVNPVGTKVIPANLVERDKWQAGLSDGVIAMQTSIKGGTTHAMNASLKYHRPLAVLGLTTKKDSEAYQKIEGNIKYIKNKSALAITNYTSIENFINNVKFQKEKRLKQYNKKSNDIIRDISLFEN